MLASCTCTPFRRFGERSFCAMIGRALGSVEEQEIWQVLAAHPNWYKRQQAAYVRSPAMV